MLGLSFCLALGRKSTSHPSTRRRAENLDRHTYGRSPYAVRGISAANLYVVRHEQRQK
jgi:hypothetical protein